MTKIITNRWLLLTVVAAGVLLWLLVTQSHLPALSAPDTIGRPP
jgi:hypothetical protein